MIVFVAHPEHWYSTLILAGAIFGGSLTPIVALVIGKTTR